MSKQIENIALVSAAGAGKTRALTQRFLLLYLHKRNFPLDSLYGITFTNEAAFEMKSRIVHYLDLLITGKPKDESEEKIIQYFSKLFSDIKERAILKKRYLLNNLSELNISTFHSLFASFLSSIPFAAGILPGYRIIDEAQEAIVYESVLDSFLETVHQDDALLNVITELLEQQETRVKDSIKNMFWHIVPWLDFLQGLADKEETIKSNITAREEAFVDSLQELAEFIQKHESAGYVSKSGRLHKDLRTLLSKVEEYCQTREFATLDASEYTKSILRRDIETKAYVQKFMHNLAEASSNFMTIINNVKKCTEAYLNSLSDQQILIHLKPIFKVFKQFQDEKQYKNVLSFDDIEQYTLRALQNNPEPDYLYFKIGAEIRHLMIDEFQDTSHRQLEILEPLIAEITALAPSEKSFFYVGDPRQAIFRWRGGNPELFYALLKRYSGKIKPQELTINYRSKEEIIRFVNTVLDKNDEVKPGNIGGWVRLEHLGDVADRETGEQQVMERTTEIIKELTHTYGYHYSDIAVLVRTNKFGSAIADTLTLAKIPCVSRAHADILSNDDVQFILNLLKFLDDPQNDFALLHVLLSPVFNIKEETLRRLRYGKKTLFMILSDSHPGWTATKKLKELLALVYFCNPYELIYRIYKTLQIKISYPLATLLDVALQYTREGFGHLSSFIDWIEKTGSSIEIKEIHPEGVKIFTTHKAKGLEFEVVIIPETHFPLQSYENRQLLFAYTDDGTKPEKIYWRAHGKYFSALRDAEEKRLKNDELNLLYVALTRAKNGVYVLGFDLPKNKRGFWMDTVMEKIGSTEHSVGNVVQKEKITVTKEEKPYGAIIEGPLVIREERSLYSPTEHGVEIIEPTRRKGMEFGTLIHQTLSNIEWLDGCEFQETIDDIITSTKNAYVRIPEDAQEIEERLRPLLVETLTDPDLRWLFYKDNREVRCKNELSLYFEEEKRDVSCLIDRLIIEANRVYIIDYKTGEEKPEYKHQMNMYKKGVKTIYPDYTIKAYLVYLERERGNKLVEC